jgi:hypothetical protein
MILFKNLRNKTKVHNILGFDFILKTDKYYIEFNLHNDIVSSINYTNIKHVKKYDEYEMTLDECYEIVVFCNDIKIVLGCEILVNNNILAKDVLEFEIDMTGPDGLPLDKLY